VNKNGLGIQPYFLGNGKEKAGDEIQKVLKEGERRKRGGRVIPKIASERGRWELP